MPEGIKDVFLVRFLVWFIVLSTENSIKTVGKRFQLGDKFSHEAGVPLATLFGRKQTRLTCAAVARRGCEVQA